jgi:hypothetical protein
MTNCVALAKGRLNDPTLMEWALDLAGARSGASRYGGRP